MGPGAVSRTERTAWWGGKSTLKGVSPQPADPGHSNPSSVSYIRGLLRDHKGLFPLPLSARLSGRRNPPPQWLLRSPFHRLLLRKLLALWRFIPQSLLALTSPDAFQIPTVGMPPPLRRPLNPAEVGKVGHYFREQSLQEVTIHTHTIPLSLW